MPLLWIAVAYGVGVGLATLIAPFLPFDCSFAAWLWLAPAALLPITPLLNRWQPESRAPLLWQRAYGFRAPRRGPSLALVAACALALGVGMLRLWGAPLAPCSTRAHLAFYNAPADKAYDAEGPWYTVEGYIASYVAQSAGSQRITVAATALGERAPMQPVHGRLTTLTDESAGLQYGDRVTVRGILSEPPVFADFSYKDYLARNGIHSQMNLTRLTPIAGEALGNPVLRLLYDVRSRGEALINQMLPEPHASLANGMLLGIDANISDEVMQRFNDTSASHVIVISGSNVALVAGVLLALSSRLLGGRRKRAAYLWTLLGIALYATIVGAEASVVRAAIMGALVVLATALGRRSTAIVSLSVASLLMALANPHVLWDVGFQLSAVATLGLVLLAPALRPGSAQAESASHGAATVEGVALPGGRGGGIWRETRGFLLDTVAVSLAATLAVTPLLLYHFERLSVIGMLTNLLIAPVQPLILFSGMAALTVGLAGILPGAQLLLAATWAGLAWTVAVVDVTARMRWANLAVGGSSAAVIGAVCVLIGVLIWQSQRRGAQQRERTVNPAPRVKPAGLPWQVAQSRITLGALLFACALVWLGVRARADGLLHLWYLPAERGHAVLVQSPTGRQVLVDGGNDGGRLLSGLGAVMGFWDRALDMLILTSADARTIEAQGVLVQRLSVEEALTVHPVEDRIALWVRALEAGGVTVNQPARGSALAFDDGMMVRLLGATGDTETPLLLQVAYGSFTALIPGTTDVALDALPQEATIVSIPNAGRRNVDVLLADLAFTQAIIFGDETPASASAVRYPNVDGVVHVWSDGSQWWLDVTPP